jgi:hypothetical protein
MGSRERKLAGSRDLPVAATKDAVAVAYRMIELWKGGMCSVPQMGGKINDVCGLNLRRDRAMP